MPFPYETSATPVRVRRSKDKDKESRSTASSSSGKKTKRSGSSNRSPPQADRSSQLALYTQQNLTLDQLPALPESGTASPGSAASPLLRAASCTTAPSLDLGAAARLYTPAALQKYLQAEDDRSNYEAGPLPEDHREESRRRLSIVKRNQADNQPLDSQTSTPLATSVREDPKPSQNRSSSPSFFSQPVAFYESSSSHTSSSKTVESLSQTASSPPPSPSSPSAFRSASRQSFPALEQPQPRPHFAFLGSPPTLPPPPVNSASPNHHPGGPTYPGPYYYPMTQPIDQHVDPHSLYQPINTPYTNYSGIPFHPNHFAPYAPIRVQSSTSSRTSMASEPLPSSQPVPAHAYFERTPSLDSPGLSRHSGNDDAVDLLQRIQSAIPDISQLLNRYRETSGELGMRENLIKEAEAQKTAALRQNESHIEKLSKELEDVKSNYSAESSKLRFEISNMEEKQKDLRETLLVEQKSKDDLHAKNAALLTELDHGRAAFEEAKSKIVNESEEWRRKAAQAIEDNQVLEDNLRRQKDSANTVLQSRLADLSKTYAKEKEALQANLARQKTDLEAAHARVRQDLEKDIGTHQAAVEESRSKHAQDREAWEKERAILGKGSEEQRKILASQHQKEIEGIRNTHEASETLVRKQAQDQMKAMHDQIDRLKANWAAEQASLAKSVEGLKAQATRMDDENRKLQKLADTLGEVTHLKSQEDPFYLKAFKDLEKQIADLAAGYFVEDPVSLPEKTIRAAVTDLPLIFSGIGSSPPLRRAFVEHRVSDMINKRIFQPFLFLWGEPLQAADKLLIESSRSLKHKSTRLEMQWRQRFLHAAYNAKAETNDVAIGLTKEIVEVLGFLVDRRRIRPFTAAVRNIVKTAVETWRYARLEPSLVHASMDMDKIAANSRNGIGPSDANSKALLPLFPLIKREAAYDFVNKEYQSIDNGLVYCHGRVFNAEEMSTPCTQVEAQGRQASVDSILSTNSDNIKDNPSGFARPQSPLVPTKPPARRTAQDRHRYDRLWADDSTAPRLNVGQIDFVHPAFQESRPEVQPAESERNRTQASSRQSSITTTASNNSTYFRGRSKGNTDGRRWRQPSSSSSIVVVDVTPEDWA